MSAGMAALSGIVADCWLVVFVLSLLVLIVISAGLCKKAPAERVMYASMRTRLVAVCPPLGFAPPGRLADSLLRLPAGSCSFSILYPPLHQSPTHPRHSPQPLSRGDARM